MIRAEQAAAFLVELDSILEQCADPSADAVQLIARRFAHYKWVGIYWLESETLILGPYVGAATEHDRIAVGQGVCGTAVAEGRNQIITDVRQITNYLACSVSTRSEIVVLIRNGDTILGQIDADADEVGAFDSSDESLLIAAADRLAGLADG